MVTILLQARLNSQRLPGKVLFPLQDKTVLGHILTRLKTCRGVADIVICTSLWPDDTRICEEARHYGVQAYRGGNEDVLGRFAGAAEGYTGSILRFCADNPFLDPAVLDEGIRQYEAHPVDYMGHAGLPIGLGFEIFTKEALLQAHRLAAKDYEREHVTPYIMEHAKTKAVYRYPHDYSRYRLTLDTDEDWRLTQELYQRLYRGGADGYFGVEDVVGILKEEPELAAINAGVIQRKPGK